MHLGSLEEGWDPGLLGSGCLGSLAAVLLLPKTTPSPEEALHLFI